MTKDEAAKVLAEFVDCLEDRAESFCESAFIFYKRTITNKEHKVLQQAVKVIKGDE